MHCEGWYCLGHKLCSQRSWNGHSLHLVRWNTCISVSQLMPFPWPYLGAAVWPQLPLPQAPSSRPPIASLFHLLKTRKLHLTSSMCQMLGLALCTLFLPGGLVLLSPLNGWENKGLNHPLACFCFPQSLSSLHPVVLIPLLIWKTRWDFTKNYFWGTLKSVSQKIGGQVLDWQQILMGNPFSKSFSFVN